MARTYTAFINRDQIPLRSALQAAIKAQGFKLTLEEDYEPFSSPAYLPCTLDGEDAGLTIHFIESSEIPSKNTAITLQWSGDPREKASVIMIAATLANHFAATVRNDKEVEKDATTLITEAKKAFTELD